MRVRLLRVVVTVSSSRRALFGTRSLQNKNEKTEERRQGLDSRRLNVPGNGNHVTFARPPCRSGILCYEW